MYPDFSGNIKKRIRSMGLSDEAVAAKLEKYAFLDESDADGNWRQFSARGIHNIAEDLMTTFNWVITGEHAPGELHMTVRNVLNGSDGSGGNKDWVEAEKAVRDAAMAYEQILLGPSPKYAWKEPQDIAYALPKLNERAQYGSDLDFFGMIEEYFGVDVFVIDSDVNFDAIGAMVMGSPFIVAKRGQQARSGHYAVVRELASMLIGNLARYSDVYSEKAGLDAWEIDFAMLMFDSYNGLAPITGDPYGEQRFPQRVIDAHREAVAEKHNLGYFLEWMTGEKPPVVEHEPIDLDEMARLFGFGDDQEVKGQ
jgi:hypothetical protein